MERPQSRGAGVDGAHDLLSIIEIFRTTIHLFGKNASLDGSAHSIELDGKLGEVDRRLAAEPTAACVKKYETRIQSHIEGWGKRVADDSKRKVEEFRELLLSLAKTAETIGNRDRNYTTHFSRLTGHLEKIGDLNDLSQIRAQLGQHVSNLKLSVEQMAQESRNLVAELKNEVSSYKSKLKRAEDLASTDELTGAANRRGIEFFIDSYIAKGSVFTVVILDIDEFKAINDSFGHVAGDEILMKFARALRSSTRQQDLVGRLGGDEFIVVMTCGESRARSMLGKVKGNVFTRYMLRDDNGNFLSSIQVNASTGVAEWQAGETIQQLIARADAEMYKNKEAAH